MREKRPVLVPEFLVTAQKVDALREQVVKIHGLVARQALLVGAVDPDELLFEVAPLLRGKRLRGNARVLVARYRGQQNPRRHCSLVNLQFPGRFFHKRELIVGVEDRKRSRKSEAAGFPP